MLPDFTVTTTRKLTVFILLFVSAIELADGNEPNSLHRAVIWKAGENDGLSWSARIEVTEILNCKEDGSPNQDDHGNWIKDVNGFPCDFLGRAFHMPGPGYGIQLSNGRLLIQVWNRTALGMLNGREIPAADRNYGLSTIYSDDHGKTWKQGSAFGHGGLNMNESRMAELDNGDVYLNAKRIL